MHYGKALALEGVEIGVPAQSLVAVIGPNGAGKTTLLRTISGLLRPTSGSIIFEGRSLQQMSDDFQSPIGTIKRRLHTARNRLRDQLAKLEPVG